MFSAMRVGALALLAVTSCQVGSSAHANSPSSTGLTDHYGTQMRLLFDDDLGGVTLGGSAAPRTPEASKLMARRILEADVVIACQIQTITEGSAGNAIYARLEFRGAGQFLSHDGRGECPTISISSQSYSFLLIHHSSNVLIGKSIVLFLKKFNESGQETLHWHGEPDGVQIREEVKAIGSSIH